MTGTPFRIDNLDEYNKEFKTSLLEIKKIINEALILSPSVQQSLISLYSKSRNLNAEHQINLSEITAPKGELNSLRTDPDRFKAILYKIKFPKFDKSKYELKMNNTFSLKSGVNLRPAILSIPLDQIALEHEDNKNLRSSIE